MRVGEGVVSILLIRYYHSMKPFLDLADKIFEVVKGALTPVENWGGYLFEPEFASQTALRNKIALIWFHSLYDIVAARQQYLPDIIRDAEANSWPSLADNALQMTQFCHTAADLIGTFSREDQMQLWDLRNQLAHSYFSARYRDPVPIKILSEDRVRSEHVPRADFMEIIERQRREAGSVDALLTPLIDRALDREKHRYWKAMAILQKHRPELYRLIREGGRFEMIGR